MTRTSNIFKDEESFHSYRLRKLKLWYTAEHTSICPPDSPLDIHLSCPRTGLQPTKSYKIEHNSGILHRNRIKFETTVVKYDSIFW